MDGYKLFRWVYRMLFFAGAAGFLLPSCTTPLNELTYLHYLPTGKVYPHTPLPDTYRIRPNDHLYIQVIGDEPMNTAFLNLFGGQMTGGSMQNLELLTYTVDEEGKITYPQLGEIDVAGFTVTEVREGLQKMVNLYIEHTSVHIKLVNRNITVLGEVRTPGVRPIEKNHLSVFEAIGTAGDITDFGNRQNVKIIRETPQGKQVTSVDLTDPAFIHSEYYYVLPHDIIYVEPTRKVYGFKTLPYMSQFSLGMSLVSTALLILNVLK
jgi:polysaccharide biosynthesis/export protein